MTVLEPVIEFLYGFEKDVVSLSQLLSSVERPRKPILRVMDRLVREGNLIEVEDNKIANKYGQVGRRQAQSYMADYRKAVAS